MEKIKITKEQEKALENFTHHERTLDCFINGDAKEVTNYKPLWGLSEIEMAQLLCGYYEVEESFKVGDWVTNPEYDTYYKIKNIDKGVYITEISKEDAKSGMVLQTLRTPSEFEKVTEPWKIMLLELGRDKPEFKVGDKYTMNGGSQITVYHMDDEINLFHSDNFKDGQVKHFYPVESRIELNKYNK